MGNLTSLIIPAIVVVVVALLISYAAERFSPDPFLTKIINLIVFAGVIIWFVIKFLPLIK